jgi:hypothetical protein
MIGNALKLAIGLALVTATAGPAAAQSITAEVRTFAGQTYRLTDITLEVLYTIVPPRNNDAGPAETAPTTGPRTPMLFGSAAQIGRFLNGGPDPLQGQRQSETVTLRKNGVDVQIPLGALDSLSFTRARIVSTLPPYVAAEHYRHAATAVLLDGSRVDGDYVNLGTTFLRGRTPSSRVDIPWQEIETVRFTR